MSKISSYLPDGYIKLATAIVRQAAKDYKEEWDRYQDLGVKSPMLLEVEDFLLNDDMALGKGAVIMEMIRNGADIIDDEWDGDE